MTIQYASDLHLEMLDNREWMELHPLIPSADILILAGDIMYLRDPHYHFEIIDKWSAEFKQVYLGPGNHEFYQRSFPLKNIFPSFKKELRKNVTYLNNRSLIIEDVKFLFTSLFTKIKYPEIVVNRMNDFHSIHFEEDSFLSLRVDEYNSCHEGCLTFLEKELEVRHEKTVVISHHIPYPGELVDYPFETSLDEVYHVDLLDYCERFKVDHWISGHNHINSTSFEVGKTTFHTNQLGYVSRDQHSKFRYDATISL
jgi:Icc-related predicted phosphoesterase